MPIARFEVHMDPDLKTRVQAEAKARGQTLRVFAERAFEAALGGSNGRGEAATGTGDPAGQGQALADPGAPPSRPSSPRPGRKPSTQRVHSACCTCAVCKPPKKGKT